MTLIDLVNLIECALDASTDVLGGTNTGWSHRTQRIDHKHRKHGGEHSSCARSYDAPGMTPTPEMMRLKPQDLGGWLAGPAQPDPETRGAGWHPRAF